jgi:hypothetical protein
MKKTGALTLDIRPSLLGQGIATLLAVLAFLVVFYLQASILVFIVLALAIAALWAGAIVRINKPRWRRVVVAHTGDQVTLTGKGKLRRSGHLDRAILNSGLVAVFRVNTEQGAQRVWLFPDSAQGDGFRHLREVLSRPKKA